MRVEVEQAQYQAYLNRCTAVVQAADHHVTTFGFSYEDIEQACGAKAGAISQMAVNGYAPDIPTLQKLETFLWEQEPRASDSVHAELNRALQRNTEVKRDLTRLHQECAALSEKVNEAKAALFAEREAHDRTKEQLTVLATDYAVAVDLLLEARSQNERLGGQLSTLGSVLYDVTATQDELADVLADGKR